MQQLEKEIQKQATVKCSQSNEAVLICVNQSCQSCAFMCMCKTCPCRKNHSTCQQGTLQSFLNILENKRISLNPFENYLIQQIQKIIDSLSKLKEQYLESLDIKYKNYGLLPHQQKFMNNVENNKTQDILGKDMYFMSKHFTDNKELLKQFSEIKSIIQKQFLNLSTKLDEFGVNIKSNLQKYFEQKKFFLKSTQLTLFKSQKIINQTFIFFKESTLLTNVDQVKRLLSYFKSVMFKKNSIIGTKILYRASQNEFSTKKFHILCDNVMDTLTILKTKNGKLLGSFSPFPWVTYNRFIGYEENIMTDPKPKLRAFIFSLDEDFYFEFQTKQILQTKVHEGPSFSYSNKSLFSSQKLVYFNIKQSPIHNYSLGYFNFQSILKEYRKFKELEASEIKRLTTSMIGQQKNVIIQDWQVWKICCQSINFTHEW